MKQEFSTVSYLSALKAVLLALAVYGAWSLATYLLEGRLLTLLRPEAVQARVAYAVVANLFFGVVVAGIGLRHILRQRGRELRQHGFRSPSHTAISVVAGTLLGVTAFLIQRPPTRDLVILLNGFAQVWVVSVAEVFVCWTLLGSTIEASQSSWSPRLARTVTAWILAACAFGVYHFAHSPPFNTAGMVGLLILVGLLTGAYFFLVRELYGTILFHNFLGLTGVTRALADSNRLGQFDELQLPLIAMALAATGLLVGIDLTLVRRPGRPHQPDEASTGQ